MSDLTEGVKRYRVTAPYITARSPGSGFSAGGSRCVETFGYNQGGILPADVPAKDIAHLLDCDLIAEID